MEQIAMFIPKWLETLSQEHELKQQLIQMMQEQLKKEEQENWRQDFLLHIRSLPFVKNAYTEESNEEASMRIQIAVKEEYYYAMLSDLSGITIDGEYQLISLIRELSSQKKEYETVRDALRSVRETGYGVVMPEREEIHWEEPVMMHSGNRYGVKMKAVSPTIHFIKAEIETEIAPIVGSENQAGDLIRYLQENSDESEGIWEINIFGKTVEQLMQEEMTSRLNQFGKEKQEKMQKVICRVLDESRNGMICLII